jgi:hypothetical protein
MNKVDSYVGFASLPLFVTLIIPFILYFLYHLVLFPLYRSDLRSVPGPFLAKVTDLHRLLLVRTGLAHEHLLRLHERHGLFVRLGPNNVSVGSLAAIPILYNTRTRHVKSAFYLVMGNVAHGKVVPTIFSTRDESVQEIMKHPIAQVYAMLTLKTYEPLVESTKSLLISKLDFQWNWERGSFIAARVLFNHRSMHESSEKTPSFCCVCVGYCISKSKQIKPHNYVNGPCCNLHRQDRCNSPSGICLARQDRTELQGIPLNFRIISLGVSPSSLFRKWDCSRWLTY